MGSASYYVQFGSHANMKKAIAEIKEQCGLADGTSSRTLSSWGWQG